MSEALPPDEYRALQYQSMPPIAAKLLLFDGSVSDGSGNIILPPDATRAETYQTMSPQAAKFLLSDGSVVNGFNGGAATGSNGEITPPSNAGVYNKRYIVTYNGCYNNRDVRLLSAAFIEQEIYNGGLFAFAGSINFTNYGTLEVMSLYAYEFKSISSANVNNFYFGGVANNGQFEWIVEINSYSSWGDVSGASGIIHHIKSEAM